MRIHIKLMAIIQEQQSEIERLELVIRQLESKIEFKSDIILELHKIADKYQRQRDAFKKALPDLAIKGIEKKLEETPWAIQMTTDQDNASDRDNDRITKEGIL